MEYEFTLKYLLRENDCNLDQLVERFGACRCTDALIGIGQVGRIGLKFTREATSAKDAIKSAMVSIRRVVPTAKLIEAGPDYVELADTAEVLGMTRQKLRKMMLSSVSFPPPVHEGSSCLWHLSDLLKWLQEKGYWSRTV